VIFARDLAEKIVRGEKTQTRRLRHGENSTGKPGGWVDEPCRYKVGRTYAVQPGRGAKSIGRIRILSVTPQAFCDMTKDDVLAEGFQTHSAFAARWLSMYGKGSWLDPVWRIEFELVKP
jgi:hypothetical protein